MNRNYRLLVFFAWILTFPVLAQERIINVDFNAEEGSLNTFFNECVGAGRANEGLRADWQKQLCYVKYY